MAGIKFGILADDLSGGMNIGVEFSSAGLRTILIRNADQAVNEAGVLIVDTETRNLPPEAAYQQTQQAAQLLQKHQPAVVVKKIDSLLRGSVGVEVAAVREVFGFEKCLLVAASPGLGRHTVNGQQYVNGQLLETLRHQVDPSSRVMGSNILAILSSQTALPVELIDLDVVRAEETVVQAKFQQSQAVILVADCVEQAQLNMLVEAAYRVGCRFFAGTYGMGQALARLFPVPTRPALIVVGSLSAAAHRQVDFLSREPLCQVIRLVYDDSFLTEPAADYAVHFRPQLIAAMARSPYVALHVAGQIEEVERLWQQANSRGMDRAAVAQRIDALVQSLVGPVLYQAGGLIATGGATAHNLFMLLDAQGLVLDSREVLPGMPGARVVGGPFAGMPFIAKPGSQGADDALLRLARYVIEVNAAI